MEDMIFFGVIDNGFGWEGIDNVKAPINSSKDDFGILLNSGGQSGYFTTNRNSGIDNIYSFHLQNRGPNVAPASAPIVEAPVKKPKKVEPASIASSISSPSKEESTNTKASQKPVVAAESTTTVSSVKKQNTAALAEVAEAETPSSSNKAAPVVKKQTKNTVIENSEPVVKQVEKQVEKVVEETVAVKKKTKRTKRQESSSVDVKSTEEDFDYDKYTKKSDEDVLFRSIMVTDEEDKYDSIIVVIVDPETGERRTADRYPKLKGFIVPFSKEKDYVIEVNYVGDIVTTAPSLVSMQTKAIGFEKLEEQKALQEQMQKEADAYEKREEAYQKRQKAIAAGESVGNLPTVPTSSQSNRSTTANSRSLNGPLAYTGQGTPGSGSNTSGAKSASYQTKGTSTSSSSSRGETQSANASTATNGSQRGTSAVARKTKKPDKYLYNMIFFDYKSTSINKSSTLVFKQLSSLLENDTTINAKLIGHTDGIASPDYNMKLSKLRAESAARYLTQTLGVSKDRLKVAWLGEFFPLADNEGDLGRKRNRRVEIQIFKKGLD